MSEAIPMCVMCGKWEVGTFASVYGGDAFFCSHECADKANEVLDEMYADLEGDMDYERDEEYGYGNSFDIDEAPEYDPYDNPIELGVYDDDPSPYDGTYSEE